MSDETKLSANERYRAAAHAVQTGVALALDRGDSMATPKHLRVGLDLRACDHAALARLLIAKGIITEDEYLDAVADEAEAEKQRVETRLFERYAVRIKLA